MYVCLCTGATERDVRDAIAGGACTVEEVARCTDAGTHCGSCVSTIAALLEREEHPPHRHCLRVLTNAA